MKNKRTFFFIGTTAELIKVAPVIKEFHKKKIQFTIIASGQNDIRFEEFAPIIGDARILYAVTPKGKESSLFLFLIWSIRAFFSLMIGMRSNFNDLNKSNSMFIVHGDTVSSFVGSLVAWMYGLKLVHIESGLRSFNFFEPFPEEICRYIISRLADIHFCPNAWAVSNLKSVQGEKVNTYQNTLVETYLEAMKKKSNHPILTELNKRKKRYVVLVVHRQEHVLFGKKETTEILKHVLTHIPEDLQCIFLVHDLSGDFIRSFSKIIPTKMLDRITRISRLPYQDFIHLLGNAEFMITDGGSNQEEMSYMGKPCLLLRNFTERIEGLDQNVVLSQNNYEKITQFLEHYKKYNRSSIKVERLPSEIITDYLITHA